MKNKMLIVPLLCLSLSGLASCSNKKDNTSQSSIDCNITYVAKFYMNDGTDTIYSESTAKFNTPFTRPKNPTREGYVFKGWTIDKDNCVVYLDEVAISDLKLYARWIVSSTNSSSSSSDTSSSSNNNSNSTNDSSSTSDSSSSSDDASKITYTVTSIPTWISDDGCKVFAWVWSDLNPGEWIGGTLNETKTTLSFTVNSKITGMLLVRCHKDTTTPDWSVKTNIAGRIYNQTEDITINDGVFNYPASTWKEYN